MSRRKIQFLCLLLQCTIILLWQLSICKDVFKKMSFEHDSSFYIQPYNRLIDLTNFKFTTLNLVCNSSTLLLVVVSSAPAHFKRRRVIRETWGSKRDRMSLVFFVGEVKDKALEEELVGENEEFRDLVRGNFLDSYRNMTYKLVSELKYASYHCSWAKYVLKVDDDVFIHVEELFKELMCFRRKRIIYGDLKTKAEVSRDKKDKWFVGETRK